MRCAFLVEYVTYSGWKQSHRLGKTGGELAKNVQCGLQSDDIAIGAETAHDAASGRRED